MPTTPESLIADIVVIGILAVFLGCPICAAVVASSKNRGLDTWFIMGLLFGPFGLLAIVGMPPAEPRAVRKARRDLNPAMTLCPYCIEPVREEAGVCSHCSSVLVEAA